MDNTVTIPNLWNPRTYQIPVWNHFNGNANAATEGKRAVLVWHRRSGKDSTSLNITAAQMLRRVGTYFHMLPTTVQARRVVWAAIDGQGRRMIDQVFPREIRRRINNSDMSIELVNGSIWQCVGSDNFDAIVGTNPVGVIFSEYSICNPDAWNYIRPILAENGGWAIFIYTARGKNHGYRLYEMAKENPNWFCQMLTVDDTRRDDGRRVITESAIEEERMAGMDEETVQQEFFCSFEGGMSGAFYTKELAMSRVGHFPHNPSAPCITIWDIGISDDTAIGIFQQDPISGRIVQIDELFERNKDVSYYIRELRKLPYDYTRHFAPHDFFEGNFSGVTSEMVARDLGFFFEQTPKLSLEDGIAATRAFLKQISFNEATTIKTRDSVSSYQRIYDPKKQMYQDKPYHNWASHGADMIRYAAINLNATMFSGKTSSMFKTKRAMPR